MARIVALLLALVAAAPAQVAPGVQMPPTIGAAYGRLGKQVMRPFTDIRAKRGTGWQLIARQATIAALR